MQGFYRGTFSWPLCIEPGDISPHSLHDDIYLLRYEADELLDSYFSRNLHRQPQYWYITDPPPRKWPNILPW